MKQHGAYKPSEARNYDRDREVEPLWHVENHFVEQLVKRLTPRMVLDVPVGTGRFLDFYGAATVEGVDLSDAMLAEATARASQFQRGNITLRLGDVTELPFNDDYFDLVVCWRLLHLLPHDAMQAALKEMARVCTGYLCVQVYERAPLPQRTAARALRWLRRLTLIFTRRDRLTPWSHITSYSYSRAQVEAAALAAGLGQPLQREVLGGYEGTRVVALVWQVA